MYRPGHVLSFGSSTGYPHLVAIIVGSFFFFFFFVCKSEEHQFFILGIDERRLVADFTAPLPHFFYSLPLMAISPHLPRLLTKQ